MLAVKPQNAAETLPAYARFAGHAVFLSIMAGRTIAGIAASLAPSVAQGGPAAIVRAMPNTPAAVRQGVTVACAGAGVNDAQRGLCDRLLQAIGTVAWAEQEALLDPVTAVSGSGPAYVFLLAELMEQAAIEQGIPADTGQIAGAPDGLRFRCVTGGQPGHGGRFAPGRHQPGRHDGGSVVGVDGARRLARFVVTRDRLGDAAVSRIGQLSKNFPRRSFST